MNMKSIRISSAIVTCTATLVLGACQSSSQSSSQSSPSMPMPSSSSQSSSRSASTPATPGPSSSSSQAATASQGQQGPEAASSAGSQQSGTIPSRGQQSRPGGDISSGSGANNREAQPGAEQISASGARDRSTGDLNQQSGGISSNIPQFEGSGGDYSLDTLPGGVLSGSNQSGSSGPMTASERARVLDETLRKGYETFDGFILSEREKAQNESNAAGSAQPGGGGGGNSQAQPQTMQEVVSDPSGVAGAPPSSSVGRQSAETFPAPDDIPSGRDDDVVARQLREAAMSEPDPELREALWDEYRNYTGISGGAGQ